LTGLLISLFGLGAVAGFILGVVFEPNVFHAISWGIDRIERGLERLRSAR
jgi:hypothetical protein